MSQDLVFYHDNSLISDAALSNGHWLTIVSHLQGTSPAWLVDSLVENALVGTAAQINQELHKTAGRSHVYFASFVHPYDFLAKGCKKNGLDLAQHNFHHIDCFTNLFAKVPPVNAASPAAKLFGDIEAQLLQHSPCVVFLESPHLLLLATDLSASDLVAHIMALSRASRQVVLVVPQDSPHLVDLLVDNPADVVFKYSEFLTKLYHRSHLNVHLQPLPTGRAKDITGSITVTKGCVPGPVKIMEKEYIYHLSKESSIKLSFR